MPLRFDQLASATARALQIYLILIGCAANQQLITHAKLTERLGFGSVSLIFPPLELLAQWCLREGLPPLTALAVADDTWMPGPGYPLPLEKLAAQQGRVRKFDWYAIIPPALADLDRPQLAAAE